MTPLPVLASTVLAAGGESKKSGPLGLAVILVLCVARYFLFKSMSKHLRKVREEFPADPAAPADPPALRSPASEPAGSGSDAHPPEPGAPSRPDDPA